METRKISEDDQIIGGMVLFVIISILLIVLFCMISYDNGVRRGRIDIASGRVTATQVPNRDGLTEWQFTETKQVIGTSK